MNAPAPRRGRLRRALPLACAGALGACSIALASAFEAGSPAPLPPPDGISVEGGAIHLSPGSPQWNSIELARVEAAGRTWSDPFPARVRIDEGRAARIGAPLPGRVVAVHVDLGEEVQAGTRLFTVASPAIAELRAEADRVEAELALARRNRERIAALVAANAIPAKEELQAAQQLAQAEVAWRSAREKLAALQVDARAGGTYTVVAPGPGVVVERALLPGQEVTPEVPPLLTLAAIDSLWVVADLLPGDTTGIVPGARARITVPALRELEVEGVVERIAAVVDPERNTVPVRIRVANEQRLLLPNLFVQAAVERAAEEGAVEVPASAVVSDGARQFVFVQEAAGRFVRREVVTRSTSNGRMPIVAGLRPSESVVARGAVLLGNHLTLAN